MKVGKWLIGMMALAIVSALFFLPATAKAAVVDSGTCGENATYTLDDQGVLTVSGTGPMDNWPGLHQPWYGQNIKAVVIEEGITAVGEEAFARFSALSSVKLASTVTSIGDGAFFACTALKKVQFPDGVEYLGENAFGCCTGLQDIVVPDSVKSMYSAFSRCSGLERMTIPWVGEFFGALFGQFEAEGMVYTPHTYTYDGESFTVGMYVPAGLKTVTVTGGEIGVKSFGNCKNLETILLGENVTGIRENAFYNCGVKEILIACPVTIMENIFHTVTADVYTVYAMYSSTFGGDITWHNFAARGRAVHPDTRRVYAPGEALEISYLCNTYTKDGRTFMIPAGSPLKLGAYDNSTPGAKTVKVYYEDKKYMTFEYVVADLAGLALETDATATFDGTLGQVAARVTCYGYALTPEVDYTLSYENNTAVTDSAIVRATGRGAYEGWSATAAFSVLKGDLSEATVTCSDCTYRGYPVTPTVSVHCNGVTLKKDEDYILVCRDNIAVGTGTVQVLGIGNYKGFATGTFTIKKASSGSSGGSLSYSTGTSTSTTGAVNVDFGEDIFSGYELYKNGVKVSSGSDRFGKYLYVNVGSYGTGTYTLRVYVQGYTYIVQGGQYVAKPSGTKSWKSFTVTVTSGSSTPSAPSVPTELTALQPVEVNFHTWKLEVDYMPYRANIYPLVWESSDPAVASVDNGILQLHKAGKTTVTATYNGLTAIWKLDIPAVDISKASKVYYDATAQTVKVVCENELLTDADYTFTVIRGEECDELVITGIGLFGESITKRYVSGTDEPYCMGDLNEDLVVNTDDVVALLLHVSMPDVFPVTAPADFTHDGLVNTDDVVALLLHVSMPDVFPL